MVALSHYLGSLALFLASTDGARILRKHAYNQSLAGSSVIDFPDRQYKVFYPDKAQGSCEAVLFSVGTAVGVNDYNSMSEALLASGFIVAVVDPEKGSLFKNNVEKLRFAYGYAKDNLVDWSGGACASISKWIVGGHSAGGGTAHKIFADDPTMADAIFSVDPYTRGDMGGDVALPALYWGFEAASCFVNSDLAAAGYYKLAATEKRVFIRAAQVMESCGWRQSPKYFHCAIVDGGCTGCTHCEDTPRYFFEDVANSVTAFSSALSGSWSRERVAIQTTTPTDIFVGSEEEP